MPIYKCVTAHVTDADGYDLKEYGIKTQNSEGLISCYIESKNEMRFKIYLEAIKDHLFPPDPKPKKGEPWKPTPPEVIAKLALHPAPRRSRSPSPIREYGHGRYRSPSPEELPFKAPWHFLVTLHLDGRDEAEAFTFLYLDEDQDDEVVLAYTSVEESDGSSHRHYWSFKDVGIESVFTQLELDAVNPKDEARPNSSAGQIEIRVQRITLGPTRRTYALGDHSKLPEEAAFTALDSHIISRKKGRKIGGVERIPEWKLYDPEENVYARFKFYYRDARTLRRMKLLRDKKEEVGEDMEGVESGKKRAFEGGSEMSEMAMGVDEMELDDYDDEE